jgi:hypothetical protein
MREIVALLIPALALALFIVPRPFQLSRHWVLVAHDDGVH